MKKTLLSVLFCCLFVFAFADNVITVQEAKTVSKNFITAVSPTTAISESDFILKQTARDENDEPLYYVFGIRNGGFIIVSATDAATPVLAYSLENEFKAEVCSYFLDNYKADIASVKGTTNVQAVKEWEFLRNYTPTRDSSNYYIVSEVKPLLTSTWNQVTYYNNHCPAQADAIQNQINLDCDGHVPAGCVAADMGVIMHYYRYPEYGTGGVGYHPIHYVVNDNNEITDTITYPWQVQNFNVLHDYNLMPNSIDAYTGEVAKLLWHAGISVQMDYGPSGSGAQSADALTALKNNWGYERTAQMYSRGDYSNVKWCDRRFLFIFSQDAVAFAMMAAPARSPEASRVPLFLRSLLTSSSLLRLPHEEHTSTFSTTYCIPRSFLMTSLTSMTVSIFSSAAFAAVV